MRTATPKGQPTPIPGTPKFEPFTVPTHSTGPYAYDAQRHPTRCSEFVCLNESSCGNCASPNCNNNGVCKPGKHHCSWRPFRQRPNTARRVAKIKIKLLLAHNLTSSTASNPSKETVVLKVDTKGQKG